MRINGITANTYTTRGTSGQGVGNEFRWLPQMDHFATAIISIVGGYVQISVSYCYVTTGGVYTSTIVYGILKQVITSITSINIFTSSLASFKIGDVVKLIKT